MATAGQGGWFARRGRPRQPEMRVLTAAATRLDLADRAQARRERALRQGWQADAWGYRDAIGELRYAVQFLANCAARMRLYPAAYPTGADVETDSPIPLKDITDCPPEVLAAAQQSLVELGNGRRAIAAVLRSLSTNKSVTGECFLLGRQDPQTGRENWSIRSTSEIVVRDDRYQMREIPSDPQGVIPWVDLEPDETVLSRIWTPHPQFALLADSPIRGMLDDCESLLILRRGIRATGRSRLAGRGLLGIPEEMSIKVPGDDNDDPEADPFMSALTQAMMEPISDEGVASAVVPIVVRGPGEHLKNIVHLDFASKFDEMSSKTREELIGIIATTFDLPKEIVQGVVDLNHWSAWQVDDSTFRHHVEPHVIDCCDSLTGAFLHPYMQSMGLDPDWVERVVYWYDPTELVTHPDQTKDALELHDRLAISNEALLRVAGFNETDAPTQAEFMVRLLHNMRTWPPNVVMAAIHELDPNLTIPAITVSGTIPGVKPSGVDVGEPPSGLTTPGAPSSDSDVASGPPTAGPTPAITPGPPPATETEPAAPTPITASGRQPDVRLSRKLAQLDRELRARLQTAANAAMLRQLERAGAKLRTKVARDETLRTKIAQRPNERVPAILGPDVVTAAGLTARDLLGSDWSGLRAQFHQWVERAQNQALAIAARLAGLDAKGPEVSAAQDQMAAGRDAAWEMFSTAMTGLGQHLLYQPDPNATGEWGDLNPDTLVPMGTVRSVLAVAGGATSASIASDAMSGALAVSEPLGQIGTGQTVGGLLTDAGGESAQFEWQHGPSINSFEPHEDLDGEQFASFDDDALANSDGFPDNAYFMPGDHDGCSCDFAPLWDFPGNPLNDSSAEE